MEIHAVRYARIARHRLASSAPVRAAMARRARHHRPDLIFVLGSQRSGTNALRQSLSLDPYVQGFNERQDSELYTNWRLRPEPEVRRFLQRCPHAVLLKPIQSVIDRPVAEFLADYADYRLKVAWIYRDPMAVFRSRSERWSYKSKARPFIREWKKVNTSALDAADPRIAIVNYDQLAADPAVFKALCRFLGVRGENLFRSGRPSQEVESELSEDDVADIRARTGRVLGRLDAAAAQFLATHGVAADAGADDADAESAAPPAGRAAG